MPFELLVKPTFLNQLLSLPRQHIPQVLDKVRLLRDDPRPRGDVKKKLVGYKGDVYRLRAGDYRILYSYGDGWVALLGVDDRRDIYKGDRLVADAPDCAIGQILGAEDLLRPTDVPAPPARPAARRDGASADWLPVRLDADLLSRLHVDSQWFAALARCETFDDLIAADIPENLRERLFDLLTAPDFDRVLQQPSYVADDVSDLLQFVEGDLLAFLLKLDPEQERFVTWALEGAGPVLVKGGPGTGKSVVALYRARALLHVLRRTGVARPRLLFTTYTNALVASSRQLLARLVAPADGEVVVQTADSLVWQIVDTGGGAPNVLQGRELREALRDAVAAARFEGTALAQAAQRLAIERLSLEYLLEEVCGVIEARALDSLEAYLAAPRPGRRVPLNATQRMAVWRVYEAFVEQQARRQALTWQGLRRRALAFVRAGCYPEQFDAVIVDEAQDLDPTVLRLLVLLCRHPDRLFVTADANQAIYGSGFRWTDVHADLRFQGRTGVLRQNHRSTREIGEAARAYLRVGALDDAEEPAYVLSGGPLPVARAVRDRLAELELLRRFLPAATREARVGLAGCAVLVPSEHAGRALAARLTEAGLEAAFMSGRELDLVRRVVKVVPMKSAKGLEFPVVALAGFFDGRLPGIPRGGDSAAIEEALLRERRTLYVAMTRAMRALLVVMPADDPSPLFSGFDPQYWNVGSGSSAP